MAQAPPVALAMAARTALNAGAVFFSSSASTASISLRMSPIPAAREHRQSASIRNRFRTEHATRKMGAVHKVACPIFGSSPQPPPADERDHRDHQRQEGVEPDEHFEGGHPGIKWHHSPSSASFRHATQNIVGSFMHPRASGSAGQFTI